MGGGALNKAQAKARLRASGGGTGLCGPTRVGLGKGGGAIFWAERAGTQAGVAGAGRKWVAVGTTGPGRVPAKAQPAARWTGPPRGGGLRGKEAGDPWGWAGGGVHMVLCKGKLLRALDLNTGATEVGAGWVVDCLSTHQDRGRGGVAPQAPPMGFSGILISCF